MNDNETLFNYRMQQAEDTLSEAEKMLAGGFSARSIMNRGYYASFYALLALYIKTNAEVKTSKHIGIISLFDREFVKTGKFSKEDSVILHDLFDFRLEGDYKELADITNEEAAQQVIKAKKFVEAIKKFLHG